MTNRTWYSSLYILGTETDVVSFRVVASDVIPAVDDRVDGEEGVDAGVEAALDFRSIE